MLNFAFSILGPGRFWCKFCFSVSCHFCLTNTAIQSILNKTWPNECKNSSWHSKQKNAANKSSFWHFDILTKHVYQIARTYHGKKIGSWIRWCKLLCGSINVCWATSCQRWHNFTCHSWALKVTLPLTTYNSARTETTQDCFISFSSPANSLSNDTFHSWSASKFDWHTDCQRWCLEHAFNFSSKNCIFAGMLAWTCKNWLDFKDVKPSAQLPPGPPPFTFLYSALNAMQQPLSIDATHLLCPSDGRTNIMELEWWQWPN